MAAEFQGVSESFQVSLLSDSGEGSERVCCQIGLDGLFVQSPDGKRTLRKYPLNHISRWALRGSKLVLYTKTPVDVEERTVTLQGDDRTIRSVLDTLTCCCMQMVELLQSKEATGERTQAATSIAALLTASQKKLPTADEVSFWEAPQKAGWLQSQGDHLKTWRRRWFVLKDGFLFRFSAPDPTAGSKPRGIVDLSKVTDASEARTETGRDNSLKLVTATGGKACYLADSETEQVEWLSALDGANAKILKQVAGVEDEPAPAARPSKTLQAEWASQLKESYNVSSSATSARSRYSPRRERDTLVRVVGYEGQDEAQGPSGRGGSESYGGSSYGGGRQPAGSSLGDYGAGIAGVAGVRTTSGAYPPQPHLNPTSSFSDSFVRSDYPSYPVLAPTPAQQQQQYAAYAPPEHQYSAPLNPHLQPQQGQQPYGSSPHPFEGQEQLHQAHFQPPQQQQQQYSAPPRNEAPPTQAPAYAAYAAPEATAAPYQQYTPQQAALVEPPPAPPSAWQVHTAPDGRPYYHNPATGVTQWEQP